MTWTATLMPARNGNREEHCVLLRHDCGQYAVYLGYARAAETSTRACSVCNVREGYVLPSLASYPT